MIVKTVVTEAGAVVEYEHRTKTSNGKRQSFGVVRFVFGRTDASLRVSPADLHDLADAFEQWSKEAAAEGRES